MVPTIVDPMKMPTVEKKKTRTELAQRTTDFLIFPTSSSQVIFLQTKKDRTKIHWERSTTPPQRSRQLRWSTAGLHLKDDNESS
jgi:hypothetical protein